MNLPTAIAEYSWRAARGYHRAIRPTSTVVINPMVAPFKRHQPADCHERT